MPFDNRLDNCQSQPLPAARTLSARHLIKALEDAREMLRWDAAPGIVNCQFDLIAPHLTADRHLPTFGREFNSIGQQVAHHLLQSSFIAGERRQVWRQMYHQVDFCVGSQQFHLFEGAFDDSVEIGLADVQSELSGIGAA